MKRKKKKKDKEKQAGESCPIKIWCLWSEVLTSEGGDWKGVKAGGGAREFVLPCRTFGIGQAALTVTKQVI